MHEHLRNIVEIINYIFLVYIILYTVFLSASVVHGMITNEDRFRRKKFHKNLSMDNELNYVPISVLVPAYNEEVTILDTVLSLCDVDYPQFEIIVVDDGSTDGTSQKLIDALHLQRRDRPIRFQVPCENAEAVYEAPDSPIPITLVRKKNGGKADALNMGINLSRYPYYLSLDADSVLQKDALKKIIMPVISDTRTIAVGGMVQVADEAVIENGRVTAMRFPKKFVVLMQLLEYARTFMAMRMLLDTFNGNLIISGACGLFRKDIVIEAGGYQVNTVGEDMELVVKLHAYCRSKKIPYRIAYEPEAICWSQVPNNLRDLKRQRRRWQMGLMQSMSTHRMILFNPLYGVVSTISTFYYLMVEALGPFIEILGVINIILASWLEMLNVPFMVRYFLLFYCLSALTTITSVFSRSYVFRTNISFLNGLKVIAYSFIESFLFHHVVNIFRLTAFWNYNKNKMQWGNIHRYSHYSGAEEKKTAKP